MRQLNAACLLCRHSVIPKSAFLTTSRLVRTPIRASSLSAIHRGLRESEKSRPQGFKPGSLATSPSGQSNRSTSRSRRDPDWVPPTFKLKKGKKDITDEGPQPKSRRLRFNDPDESFGKKSLVSQFKSGKLREQLARLSPEKLGSSRGGAVSKDDFERSFHESNGKKEYSRRPERDFKSTRERSRPGENRFESKFESKFENKFEKRFEDKFSRDRPQARRENSSRENRNGFTRDRPHTTRENSFRENRSGFTRDRPQTTRDNSFQENRDGFTRDRSQVMRENTYQENRGGFVRDRPQRERESTFQDSRGGYPNSGRPRDEHDASSAPTRRRPSEERDDGPIRIHHTTAASQFLYGRSVVEAALKNSRRQLYRMYIYNGEDRQNLSQDANLENLARQKEIKIVKVGRDGIRMMDKMSGGRPHNGCVLEASPLPQLPLKALGPLSEDPTKPGYSVELTYQSNEEAEINGTSDFFSYQLPRERKPFVLLLDGILDPGNLGAILRSTAFLGVNAVAISKHSSATLTPVALKASAGASEVITLFSVNSTIDFLTRSRETGWMVYAAVPSTSRSRGNSHLTVDRIETYDPLATRPTILVVGSEGEGLNKQVRREADFEVSIPSASGLLSVVDSLNVSVATGILCSAFLKKQQAGVEIENSVPTEEKESLW